MNKTLKIIIPIVCIFVLTIIIIISLAISNNKAENMEEYKLGNDTIKSIKTVLGKRDVKSVSKKNSKGLTTQEIEYKSDTVQDDLLEYTEYLRNGEGFEPINDMDLSIIPSTIELARESEDSGQIIKIKIDYDSSVYTITIKKEEGTFEIDENTM